jgi:hypothetical protein
MRYIHQQADNISAYIQTAGLQLTKCSNNGASPPEIVELSSVDDMLARSRTLWGLALPYYLSARSSSDAEAPPLNEAVLQLEAGSARNEFLLVAYQDGGLISVSATNLPFQEKALSADWWGPSY